jgi:hypothetical protein
VKRNEPMTVGQALKLAGMTRKQVMEEVYREIDLALRDSTDMRRMAEDIRSLHRNRNRLSVYVVGFVVSVVWPLVVTQLFQHSTVMMGWTTALATIGNLLVVFYAYVKRY